MKEDSRSYGTLDKAAYERLRSTEDTQWTIDNLTALDDLGRGPTAIPTLSPETDPWECATTLACCSLNVFALFFNNAAFIPVIRSFENDFEFNIVQVYVSLSREVK
jgi:hypothetical protein